MTEMDTQAITAKPTQHSAQTERRVATIIAGIKRMPKARRDGEAAACTRSDP